MGLILSIDWNWVLYETIWSVSYKLKLRYSNVDLKWKENLKAIAIQITLIYTHNQTKFVKFVIESGMFPVNWLSCKILQTQELLDKTWNPISVQHYSLSWRSYLQIL